MQSRFIQLAAIASLTLAGCGGTDAPRPLNSNAFYPRESVDRGAGVGARPQVGPIDEAGRVDPIVRKPDQGNGVNGISDVVNDSVKPPTPTPSRPLVWAPPAAGASPATQVSVAAPTTLPTGQYMIVGAVVADVDGTPIFANQVLSAIDKPLSVRAKELDERAFRTYASDQIQKEVETLLRNELVFRAAQRSLEETDRKLVDQLTAKWRQDEIVKAGGSVELARRKYLADNTDFEQAVEDQHRFYTTQVYYEKKVYPLIVVTADMMRDFYDHNLNKLFTDKTAAQFRIIRIDTKDVGDRDRALARAKEWQAMLANATEQDFAAFAHEHNTDANLRQHGGLPMEGMIDRGAYVNKPIEDAAWALQPGQVSNVITIGDVFYIVRLDNKTVGRVRPFDSEEVQDQISQSMRREQFRVLREREESKLRQNAIFRTDDHAMGLTLDMAMQRYQQWKGN